MEGRFADYTGTSNDPKLIVEHGAAEEGESTYTRTYEYTKTGNIASTSANGIYTYGETSYTNPHAVTDIDGTTYTYDNNGNLTSYGTTTLAWDYANRLISSGNGTATTTYAYDHTGQRVEKTTGGTTTYFPNKYYNKAGATTTKHIFANNELIATIEGNGTATSTYYIHTDHLGGSNVITDSDGIIVQRVKYYSFGGIQEKIKSEIRRFKKFQAMVAGKSENIKVDNMNIQNYARFIFEEGGNDEKRSLLSCLKKEILLKNKIIICR